MWLCGYVAKGLHWGNRRKVVGEPPARKTLTDLSSGLLEPQGKPGWGKMKENMLGIFVILNANMLDRLFQNVDSIILLHRAPFHRKIIGN